MPGTFEGPGQVGQGARQMYDFQDHSPTGVAFGPHLNVELFGAGVEFSVALGKQTEPVIRVTAIHSPGHL